jgi:hypothetical protein
VSEEALQAEIDRLTGIVMDMAFEIIELKQKLRQDTSEQTKETK